MLINVPAQEVFDFVSKPENMPYYLETVIYAFRLGDGKVRIGRIFRGQEIETDGWFDVDDHHLMMRWGADSESRYVGHLTVTPMDAFTSKGEVHMMFEAGSPDSARIQATLDQAMIAIKQVCEDNSTKIPAELQLGNKRYMG